MLDFEDPLFTKIGSAFITEVRTEDLSFQMQKKLHLQVTSEPILREGGLNVEVDLVNWVYDKNLNTKEKQVLVL